MEATDIIAGNGHTKCVCEDFYSWRDIERKKIRNPSQS